MPKVTWCEIDGCRQPVKGKLYVSGVKWCLCSEHRKRAFSEPQFIRSVKKRK